MNREQLIKMNQFTVSAMYLASMESNYREAVKNVNHHHNELAKISKDLIRDIYIVDYELWFLEKSNIDDIGTSTFSDIYGVMKDFNENEGGYPALYIAFDA